MSKKMDSGLNLKEKAKTVKRKRIIKDSDENDSDRKANEAKKKEVWNFRIPKKKAKPEESQAVADTREKPKDEKSNQVPETESSKPKEVSGKAAKKSIPAAYLEDLVPSRVSKKKSRSKSRNKNHKEDEQRKGERPQSSAYNRKPRRSPTQSAKTTSSQLPDSDEDIPIPKDPTNGPLQIPWGLQRNPPILNFQIGQSRDPRLIRDPRLATKDPRLMKDSRPAKRIEQAEGTEPKKDLWTSQGPVQVPSLQNLPNQETVIESFHNFYDPPFRSQTPSPPLVIDESGQGSQEKFSSESSTSVGSSPRNQLEMPDDNVTGEVTGENNYVVQPTSEDVLDPVSDLTGISPSSNDLYDEPMDCDLIVEKLERFRKTNQPDESTSIQEGNSTQKTEDSVNSKDSKLPLLIVLDTNILIAELPQVIHLQKSTDQNILLYVPWSVFHELDVLSKSEKEAKMNAKKAIRFLDSHMGGKDSKISGQTGEQEREAEHFFNAKNADDRILQACLQLRSQGKKTILYTNDRNLAMKASVNEITCYSTAKLRQAIEKGTLQIGQHYRPLSVQPENDPEAQNTDMETEQAVPRSNGSNNLAEAIEVDWKPADGQEADLNFHLDRLLKSCLEEVLINEMEEVFANDWMNMIFIKPKDTKPFWTLNQIFRCLDKHWIAVFGLIPGVKRSDKKSLDDLNALLFKKGPPQNRKPFWESASDADKLTGVKLAIQILSLFKRRQSYMETIQKALFKLEAYVSIQETTDMFTQIWFEIYKNVSSHCEYAKIEYTCEIVQKIPPSVLLPMPTEQELTSHLLLLCQLVSNLSEAFQNVLVLVEQRQLAVNSPELLQFHRSLTTFLSTLNQQKPSNHPASPYFSESSISLESLHQFLALESQHQMLDFGFKQLLTLKQIILKSYLQKFNNSSS